MRRPALERTGARHTDFLRLAADAFVVIAALGAAQGGIYAMHSTGACGGVDALTRVSAAAAPCSPATPLYLDLALVGALSYALFFILPSLHQTFDTKVGLTEVLVEDYTM